MCDQGHTLQFDSEKYEIRKEGSKVSGNKNKDFEQHICFE
jgi:hypothetical protein